MPARIASRQRSSSRPRGLDRERARTAAPPPSAAARSGAAALPTGARAAHRVIARPSLSGRVPSTQRASPASTSFFQIGASALMRSMISRAPAKASAAVRGRRRDRDARLAERHGADAVLGRGGLEPVALDRVGDDRRDPLLGHLAVGLVLEALDVARRALEGHDRAGGRAADEPREALDRQRLVRDARVCDRSSSRLTRASPPARSPSPSRPRCPRRRRASPRGTRPTCPCARRARRTRAGPG